MARKRKVEKWDVEELFYLVNHIHVLGKEGVMQVAHRLGRTPDDVRMQYYLELEKTRHMAV